MSRQPLDTVMERETNDYLTLPQVAGSPRSNSGGSASHNPVVRTRSRRISIYSGGDSGVRLPPVPDSSMDRRDMMAYGPGSPSGTSTNPGLTRSFSSSFAGGSATGRSPLTPSSPPGDRGYSWGNPDRQSPSHASYDAVAATGASFPTSPVRDYPPRGLESELATLPRPSSPKPIPVYPDGNIKVQCRPGELLRSDRSTFDTYRRSSEDRLPTSTRRQAPQPPTPGRQRRGETLVARDEMPRTFPSSATGYREGTQDSVEGTGWRKQAAEGFRRRESHYTSSSPSDLASEVSSPPGDYDRDKAYARYGSGPVPSAVPTLPSREPRRVPRRMQREGTMLERHAPERFRESSPRGRQQSHDELLRLEEPAYVGVARPRTRRARGHSRRRTDHSSDEYTESSAREYERPGRRRSLSRGRRSESSNRLLKMSDTYLSEDIVVEEEVRRGKRESSRSKKSFRGESSWLPAMATAGAVVAGTAMAMGLASYRKENKDVSKANRTGKGSVKSYSTHQPTRSQRTPTGTDSRGDSTGRRRRHSPERSMPGRDRHHRSSRRSGTSAAEHEPHISDRVRDDDREYKGRVAKQEDRTGIRPPRTAEAHRDRGRSVERRRRERRGQYADPGSDNEDSLERRLREAKENTDANIDLHQKTERRSERSDSDRRHGYRESRASRSNRHRLPYYSDESGSDSDIEALDTSRTNPTNRSTAQSERSYYQQSPTRPSMTTASVEETSNASELSRRKRSRSVTIEDASDEEDKKPPTYEKSEPPSALVPVLYPASETKQVQEEAAKKAKEMEEREQRENRGASGSAKDAPISKDNQGSSGSKAVP